MPRVRLPREAIWKMEHIETKHMISVRARTDRAPIICMYDDDDARLDS